MGQPFSLPGVLALEKLGPGRESAYIEEGGLPNLSSEGHTLSLSRALSRKPTQCPANVDEGVVPQCPSPQRPGTSDPALFSLYLACDFLLLCLPFPFSPSSTHSHPTLYFLSFSLPLLARLKSGLPASLAHTHSSN